MVTETLVTKVTETLATGSSYVEEFSSGIKNLPQDAGFADRLMFGLKIAAIGMLIVFLVLFILWAVCVAFKFVFAKTNIKSDNMPENANDTEDLYQQSLAADNSESVSGADEETVVALAAASIAAFEGKSAVDFNIVSVTPLNAASDDETVAVMSAAIAAFRNESDISFNIQSIKKI